MSRITAKRLPLFAVSAILLIGLLVPTSTVSLQELRSAVPSDASFSPSSQSGLNVTALWDDLWDSVSRYEIGNLTRTLSETYPRRTWNFADMSPSDNLTAAWDWANQTLQDKTDGALQFENITDYGSLVAIKRGTLPSPAPAIAITGMIDSGWYTGANDAAASTAVVLEIARVLNNYSFSCDVYFILINGAHVNLDYNPGARALAGWFEDNDIETITTLSFDRILFHRADITYGKLISLRSSPEFELYQDGQWFPDMMMGLSSNYGAGLIQEVIDLEVAEHSTAYEMWQVGRPAFHISQGHYYDFFSGTEDDTWDNPQYSYAKAEDLAASVACAVAYVGLLGAGEAPTFYARNSLETGNTTSQDIILTYMGFVNATVTWSGNATLRASIIDVTSNSTVYQRIEADHEIVMKYLTAKLGSYRVDVSSLGPNATVFELRVTYVNDCDGDTIPDTTELLIGTNLYSRDSDRDGLADDFEISIGTDPNEGDSDGDGASDSIEYQWGSSLLHNDSDLDGLSDGLEGDLGTDPTNQDTDSDGVSDFLEVMSYGTNPLSADTDSDNLEDGFEIEAGLNPLSPDSDGDGLGDFFEILNQLNPLSTDTDQDGWSDAYEIEFCMSPISSDTDADWLPDGIDWDPQVHWIDIVAPVLLVTILLLLLIFSFMKFAVYSKAK
ncbi:MAG: hypothetical protein JSW61_14305 [Candidatus Thorarchaeota archaeon]|nr:MAG: hypothetical protein JSW61_14305 [Candidatus Thorarchaeota archaeon]